MLKIKRSKSYLFGLLLLSFYLQAQVSLPIFFADNMVLQRNVAIPVWGWASPNEKVEVQFHNQKKVVKANKEGKWTLSLNPENAGGPYLLAIKAKNKIQIKNVLVGEVWICSGQSNMEWNVGQSDHAKETIANAYNPFIRHIKIDKKIQAIPQNNLNTSGWQICDSTTVSNFTGAGYFFAKKMYDELKVPIGLINTSWGGTNIETWISRDGFENNEEFKQMIGSMPKISLDSLLALKMKKSYAKIEKMQGYAFDANAKTDRYKSNNFNDSSWLDLQQPSPWESQSLPGFDGVIWLRKKVVLSAEDLKSIAVLYLSKIDDEDITYVNGVEIGNSERWDEERIYKIADGILKLGENTIVVRVVDNGGGGGIYGDNKDLKLVLGNREIPLSGNWKFQIENIKANINENEFPSLTFNAMVNPLIPFAIKGVLWYQGESNEARAFQYKKAFPLLIKDWRTKWKQGDFPFYFVQLATFSTIGNSNEGCAWAELREAQTETLKVNNTGMVVTSDIGNPNNIHPTNKQDVGQRLASLALNNLYGKSNFCNGPSFKSIEIKGNKVVVSFNDIATGLTTTDKYGYVKGFEIAGKDQVFYYAKAYIENNTIILASDKVTNPVAVHFAWIGDASDANLFNSAGLPAVPFRTDNWKTVTKNEKYTLENLK